MTNVENDNEEIIKISGSKLKSFLIVEIKSRVRKYEQGLISLDQMVNQIKHISDYHQIARRLSRINTLYGHRYDLASYLETIHYLYELELNRMEIN